MDATTIQQAIDGAKDGDVIKVSPGTYAGSFDFRGKAITLRGDAAGVILKGNGAGPVVLFHNGEGRDSLLSNVTVEGGASTSKFDAGGIYIDHASPTVENSTITNNSGCGIGVHFGAPRLTNNILRRNIAINGGGCHPPDGTYADLFGGGIVLNGGSSDNVGSHRNEMIAEYIQHFLNGSAGHLPSDERRLAESYSMSEGSKSAVEQPIS
ncbi:DUF1565 domain-containing protein [Terriglobus tenax]|uniref:DUF1565 domain-containing protein n=1 Tax=Terriglobus tenax TaxID=1111115 RepID=UPI0021E0E886|nr:DUF1565 domain-containing protein [Terriglobus tenax]